MLLNKETETEQTSLEAPYFFTEYSLTQGQEYRAPNDIPESFAKLSLA